MQPGLQSEQKPPAKEDIPATECHPLVVAMQGSWAPQQEVGLRGMKTRKTLLRYSPHRKSHGRSHRPGCPGTPKPIPCLCPRKPQRSGRPLPLKGLPAPFARSFCTSSHAPPTGACSQGGRGGETPNQASMLAYLAFSSMNARRGGTSSPINIEKTWSQAAAFSMVTWRRVRFSGFKVVSHNCSAFISPKPL